MADTQGEGASLFRQSAMNHITSADELDKYIRVTNPSAWFVLAAALLFAAGLIVWSCTATLPISVTETGIVRDGKVVCYVDKEIAEDIADGTVAKVNGAPVASISVEDRPMSKAEVHSHLDSDYIVEQLALSNWNYEVSLTPRDAGSLPDQAKLVRVDITVSENRPIDLIAGQG